MKPKVVSVNIFIVPELTWTNNEQLLYLLITLTMSNTSVLSVLCLVFPPLVSIFGLFPVIIKCDYQLILVQLFFSIIYDYPVYLVLSVQFNFVWSTHYSTVFMSTLPSLAWPCLASLKTSICVYSSSPCSSLIPPLNIPNWLDNLPCPKDQRSCVIT